MVRYILIMCLVFSVPYAMATPVTWTLQDVEFDTGATASGSFVYDADTEIYSNISIQTTSNGDPTGTGSIFPGGNYGVKAPGTVTYTNFLQTWESDPLPSEGGILYMTFGSAMTNAGGTIPILQHDTPINWALYGGSGWGNAYSFEGIKNPTTGYYSEFRYIVQGSITSQTAPPPPPAIPEPTSLLLLSTGLGVLGMVAYRRKRK